MAVVTLNRSTGSTLTGTFASVQLGAGTTSNVSGAGPVMVLTSCTVTDGSTLSAHPQWSIFVDPVTATTCRIPLSQIASVV